LNGWRSNPEKPDNMSTGKWTADPAHSEITFRVKHMMITNVTGILREFTIEVTSEADNFAGAQILFKGNASSITTGNEQRDAHLRSAEFFDVEKNPEIIFKSTSYEKANGGYKLHGDLTLKGLTKKIDLDVEFGGLQKDPWGNTKAGFTVTGKINRKDFGLTWNATLETGGMLVSDEVKVNCEIQLVKQTAEEKK
jgi:polyisoprenoid-binding protein YceI